MIAQRPKTLDRIADLYMDVKRNVIESGFAWEIDWQDEINPAEVDETEFLCELAWVILSAGMKENVVRDRFPDISKAFLNWTSAKQINDNSVKCYKNAIAHFNNEKKIKSIVASSKIVADIGLGSIINNIHKYGPSYLEIFPYVGPRTCYHLAKNIGFSVAKPDRHLVRIADIIGYKCPHQLCSDLSKVTGDKTSVVDVVFWRYANLNINYLNELTTSISLSNWGQRPLKTLQ